MNQLKPIFLRLRSISVALWITAIVASFDPMIIGAAATSTGLALAVGAMAWL